MRALGGTIRKIWHHSPNDVWIKCRRECRKLFGRSDYGWNYSLEAVLANAKHMNPRMEIERWERQWRVCRVQGTGSIESSFHLVDKNVLELGCGPLLGCGPFALFQGAESFWYIEPDIVRPALESFQVKERYFVPMYDELVSNYGEKMTFDHWYSRVVESTAPLPTGAEQLIDITISNSVLEHISTQDLSMMLEDLYLASRSGSWFSHTVDFGPHGGRLSDVYSRNRHDKPAHLNLLRKSEIEDRFRASGFEISASVVYKADKIEHSSVHKTWANYSLDDLATRVMIFIGQRPTANG